LLTEVGFCRLPIEEVVVKKLIAAIVLALLPVTGQASTITYQLDNLGQIEIARDALQPHQAAGWTLGRGPIEDWPDHWCIPQEWCEKIEIRIPEFSEASMTFFEITVDEALNPIHWGMDLLFSASPEGVYVVQYSAGNGNTLAPIPLPPAALLLIGGVAALGLVRRRSRVRDLKLRRL
jgi:hypothetical protein